MGGAGRNGRSRDAQHMPAAPRGLGNASTAAVARTAKAVLIRRFRRAAEAHDRAMYEVIRLHAEAPRKPQPDAPCNGCGVCCASEPCPLGVLASRRTAGRCEALLWHDDESRYRCGLATRPAAHLRAGTRWAAPLLKRLAQRCISAGSGCDCDVSVQSA